jgi:predicted negative regulator of RcsB-dependent stress response
MKKCLNVIGIVLVLLLFSYCGRQDAQRIEGQGSSAHAALAGIDSLMWRRADSAFVLLQEFVVSPEAEELDTFDGHYCQVLVSELLYKNDYGQSNRTELLQAVHYFDSLKQVPELVEGPSRYVNVFLSARAHYMNGVGFYERDSVVAACGEYLKALEIMETHFPNLETQDVAALRVEHLPRFMALTYGRLGELFSEQFMTEPAVVCYKNSLVFNRIEPTSANGIAKMLMSIGQQYDILRQKDTAGYYYDEAFKYLADTNNLAYRDLISARAVFNYYSGKGVEPAVSDLKRMVAQTADEDERLTRFFTIGSIYFETRQFDSAMVYLTRVFENKDDVVMKRDAARCLRDIYQITGDSLNAAQFARYQVENPVLEEESNRQVSQLNELFQQHLQWEQERAEAEKQQVARLRRNRMIVVVCVLVAVAALLAWLFYRRKMQQQRDEASQQMEAERQTHRMEQAAISGRLKRSNQEVRELKDQIKQLDDLTAKTEIAASFDEEPICRLIMDRVNKGQFKSQMDCTIYKDYALGKEQVMALREAADRHFGQFTSRLAKAYPELTRGDLDYCCLYLLGLSDADISALMQKAYPTISQRSRKIKAILGKNSPLPIALRGIASNDL